MIKMITLIVLTSLLFVDSSVATNGVRLDDIKTLTLYSDRMTEAGRGKAIPQMSVETRVPTKSIDQRRPSVITWEATERRRSGRVKRICIPMFALANWW